MKKLTIVLFSVALFLWPQTLRAHWDTVDGPVATAALKALEKENVFLVLPYVPAEAERELTRAFEQALIVCDRGPEARALAEHYFMETAVRLHRAGEGALYAGLMPAATDFGPAVPAAEKALKSGALTPLLRLLVEDLQGEIIEHFEYVRSLKETSKEPKTRAEVPAARERVSAELGFIGHVEVIFLAIEAVALDEYE